MLQVLGFWAAVVLTQADADEGRRLLRQEAAARGTRHASVEVHGNGAVAEIKLERSEGFSEIRLHEANTSGSEVARAAKKGFLVPDCKQVLEKAKELLHAYASHLISAGGQTTLRHLKVVSDALTELKQGNATDESLEVLLAALGNVTLKSALQTGNVWTAADQGALFYNCFPGLTPFRDLEEHGLYGDIELEPFQDVTVRVDTGDPFVEKHEIQYCYRLGTTTAAKIAFVAARKHIMEQVPCLSFTVVHAKADGTGCSKSRALEVRDQNNGCWSAYQKDAKGDATGTVMLNLGRGCETKGMAVHQLMKILGVRKEVNRIDRDKHLNIRLVHLRQPWMEKYFAKRDTPPEEAYIEDPFDLLSINMYPAQAYTTGSAGNNSVEPAKEPFLARFLGQRHGLSELDVEALGDLYGCPAKIAPSEPTRALAQLFLQGKGLVYDGGCTDNPQAQENLTLLLHGQQTSCATVANKHCIAKTAVSDISVPEMCPFSCLLCIPASGEVVAKRNLLFREEGMKYCDDAGCKTSDANGTVCKSSNSEARRVPCDNTDQAYCDDAGCHSMDSEGKECRLRNPTAQQIECPGPAAGHATFHTSDVKTSRGCVDLAVTGIKFKSGPKAACKDLQAYCGHDKMGDKVRAACPATCLEQGFACTPESEDEETSGDETTLSEEEDLLSEGCKDKSIQDSPVLTLFGKAQACSNVSRFCFHHVNSSTIQRKCPVSCGACVPQVYPEVAKEDSSAKSAAPKDSKAKDSLAKDSAATEETVARASGEDVEGDDGSKANLTKVAENHFSTAMPDADNTGVGCSRRRRWGFCYTRRRRNL